MKVAVCIFGLCRGNVLECIESHKFHFSCDYFYGTWSGSKLTPKQQLAQKNITDILPDVSYITAPDPDMHYHPAIDIVTKNLRPAVRQIIEPMYKQIAKNLTAMKKQGKLGRYNRYYNHTKQLLGHAYMLSQIPPEYDMIIRSRFDTRLSVNVNFEPFLEQSYNEHRAIGFGDTLGSHSRTFDFHQLKINELPPKCYLNDFLIFHPRDMLNVKSVQKLHESKELLPGERGWYQLLSYPHSDNHLNVLGGAYLDRLYIKRGFKTIPMEKNND